MSAGSGGLALAATVLALTSCTGSGGARKAHDASRDRTVTIFGLAELRGQIEPCGCTTDPLGDLARTAKLVADARAHGPTVVVDAGSLLYTNPALAASRLPQERLKAKLLVDVYGTLPVAAVGLGPYDLAEGPGAVRPPRQAANVADGPVEPPRIVDAGGVRVGVFGVVSADHAPGLTVSDPVEAARTATATLHGQKADVVVALLSMDRKAAKQLLGAVPGIDFAIADLGTDQPEPEDVPARAEQVDGAWLVVPANRGQVVSRLDLTLRGDGPFADAVGPGAAKVLGPQLDTRIAAAQQELDRFAADPSADAAFVAQKRAELDDLRSERKRLTDQPLQAPAEGSWFTLDQVRIDRGLACDAAVQTAKTTYDQAAGAANVAAAKQEAPPPATSDKWTYVGEEACEDCHEEEVAFWAQSRHAQAWATLERVGKQFDYDCTSCHVTGWGEPGGATMASNEATRSVQCEVCHGPGSAHLEEENDAQARATIRRAPPPDLCATRCHTKQHSDTFQYEAYLRDIVGKGHGEKRRAELGEGPTGHALREAGLARAKRTLGAGCTK